MAEEPDHDFEDWLASLQGKPGATDPLATALRDALQKERTEEELRLHQEAELAERRLMVRLRKEGLLEPRRQGWSKRILVGVSTAAILMLGISVTMHVAKQPVTTQPDLSMRGVAGTIKIFSKNSAASSENLLKSLREMGLQPTQSARKDGVEIGVDVSASELPRFGPWFESQGGRVISPGTYRILIIDGTIDK